ncbi:hypothetical protein MXB_4710 [Myxobolus squamalis]|nr:hypothetical protein MXB_4710 [Myxobolus squamalis]
MQLLFIAGLLLTILFSFINFPTSFSYLNAIPVTIILAFCVIYTVFESPCQQPPRESTNNYGSLTQQIMTHDRVSTINTTINEECDVVIFNNLAKPILPTISYWKFLTNAQLRVQHIFTFVVISSLHLSGIYIMIMYLQNFSALARAINCEIFSMVVFIFALIGNIIFLIDISKVGYRFITVFSNFIMCLIILFMIPFNHYLHSPIIFMLMISMYFLWFATGPWQIPILLYKFYQPPYDAVAHEFFNIIFWIEYSFFIFIAPFILYHIHLNILIVFAISNIVIAIILQILMIEKIGGIHPDAIQT